VPFSGALKSLAFGFMAVMLFRNVMVTPSPSNRQLQEFIPQ
jgi:hypothetical protein